MIVAALSFARRRGFLLLVLAMAALSCSTPSPRSIDPDLTELVAFQTNTVLRAKTARVPEARAKAVSFGAALSAEATRAEAAARWSADPALAAVADLEADVFRPASDTEEWADYARKAGYEPAAVPDAVFVGGLKRGTEMLAK